MASETELDLDEISVDLLLSHPTFFEHPDVLLKYLRYRTSMNSRTLTRILEMERMPAEKVAAVVEAMEPVIAYCRVMLSIKLGVPPDTADLEAMRPLLYFFVGENNFRDYSTYARRGAAYPFDDIVDRYIDAKNSDAKNSAVANSEPATPEPPTETKTPEPEPATKAAQFWWEKE